VKKGRIRIGGLYPDLELDPDPKIIISNPDPDP
jgi:hypothetical protein